MTNGIAHTPADRSPSRTVAARSRIPAIVAKNATRVNWRAIRNDALATHKNAAAIHHSSAEPPGRKQTNDTATSDNAAVANKYPPYQGTFGAAWYNALSPRPMSTFENTRCSSGRSTRIRPAAIAFMLASSFVSNRGVKNASTTNTIAPVSSRAAVNRLRVSKTCGPI